MISKFEEVKAKLTAFCGGNQGYSFTSNDAEECFTVIEPDGSTSTVTIKAGKVKFGNQALQEKVFSYELDVGYTPALIDDSSKQDIQAIMTRIPGEFGSLKAETVRDYLCPTATAQEFLNYLMEASVLKVNPFAKGEFHFIKDKNGRVRHVVGIQAFTRRAAENPTFSHYKCGVIVMRKGAEEPTFRETEFVAPNEQLVGGWCDVYLKDRAEPIKAAVALSEYSTGMSTWKEKPSTMIVKTAKMHALRQAFPIECNGLYGAEEFGLNPAKEVKGEFAVQEAA